MTEYIKLKDLKKISKVHKSLYSHSNQVYRVQSKTEETETNKVEYIAEAILWSKNTIQEVLSFKEAKERYPEYLL